MLIKGKKKVTVPRYFWKTKVQNDPNKSNLPFPSLDHYKKINMKQQTWCSTLGESHNLVRFGWRESKSFCRDETALFLGKMLQNRLRANMNRGKIWALRNFKSPLSDAPEISGGCGEHFVTVRGLKLKTHLNEGWTVVKNLSLILLKSSTSQIWN